MGFLDRVVGPGDRDAFAAAFLRALASELPGQSATYDPAEFCVRVGSDGAVANLQNVWSQVESASRMRRGAAARALAHATAVSTRTKIPERWENAAPLLLPKVRSRLLWELLRVPNRPDRPAPPEVTHRILGEHYALDVVCDFPEVCSSVRVEDLERWGKSFDEALMTATRNLRGRPSQGVAELRGPNGRGGVLVVMTGDTYDAARMLVVDSILAQAKKSFDPVVLPVHRDVLFVADPDDPEALELLAKLGEREFAKPYPNAGVLLRYSFGEWTPWLPPQGHRARAAFAALHELSLDRDYAEQREVLQTSLGEGGFVAGRIAPAKGDARTVAVWTDGVPTWLPQAERVVLLRRVGDDGHDEIASVPWDQFLAIAGSSVERLGMWPPRWAARNFPDAATLEKFVAASRDG